MMRFIWIIGIYVHSFMKQCMPSNLLLNRIRRCHGLKWGMSAMLLAVPYLLIAVWCSGIIENGGPDWLHLVNVICIWNALKFIVMGPYSVIQLLRLRAHRS